MSEPCPTCGEEFESLRGVSIHHGQMHPDQWEDRFWLYVDVGEEDECWEWQGSTRSKGHGQMIVDGDARGAHRLAYRLFKGEIDNYVLHKCDNPPCCNPEHLYDGTAKDNVHDCIDSGNLVPPPVHDTSGEKNPRSKLSEDQVLEIVERVESGETQGSVADEYGVDQSVVNTIVRGKSWTHVTGRGPGQADVSKLTEEEVMSVIEQKNSGESVDDIASEFDVTKQAVINILIGEMRTDVTQGTEVRYTIQ